MPRSGTSGGPGPPRPAVLICNRQIPHLGRSQGYQSWTTGCVCISQKIISFTEEMHVFWSKTTAPTDTVPFQWPEKMSSFQVWQIFKGAWPYILWLVKLVNLGDQFLFIPTENPNSRTTKRLARSHAVAHGLRNKRRLHQISGHNFHVLCSANDQNLSKRKGKHVKAITAPPASLAACSSDPFQMLAAESPILRGFLNRRKMVEITQCLTVAHVKFWYRKFSTNYWAGFQCFGWTCAPKFSLRPSKRTRW
jgi:hypothetical protein